MHVPKFISGFASTWLCFRICFHTVLLSCMVCQDSFLEPNISTTIQHAFVSATISAERYWHCCFPWAESEAAKLLALLSKMSLSTIAVRSPAILKASESTSYLRSGKRFVDWWRLTEPAGSLDSLDICCDLPLELGCYFRTHWAQHRIWRSHSCRHSSKLCKPEMPGVGKDFRDHPPDETESELHQNSIFSTLKIDLIQEFLPSFTVNPGVRRLAGRKPSTSTNGRHVLVGIFPNLHGWTILCVGPSQFLSSNGMHVGLSVT